MNELTVIQKDEKQVVSARKLFACLEIKDRFSVWFSRIVSYGFEENRDYLGCRFYDTLAKQELQDYEMSIEMAKQICMLQRSEKGKQYREYLIKVENAWNDPNAVIMRGYQLALKQAEEAKKRAMIAESVVNQIANGNGCFTLNNTAKALQLGYGNITLFKKLREMGILNLDSSPKQEQVNAGHFKVIIKHINDSVGNKPVTLVTSKGLVYLAKRFNATIDKSVLADA